MGNAVGVDFTDAGDCFASGTFGVSESGKRDALNHCVEGGTTRCWASTVIEHKMTGGLKCPVSHKFGVSASPDLMIYRDEAFGPEYRGNLFSAMFNMHKIARHIIRTGRRDLPLPQRRFFDIAQCRLPSDRRAGRRRRQLDRGRYRRVVPHRLPDVGHRQAADQRRHLSHSPHRRQAH